MTLEELEDKYLDRTVTSATIYRGNTEVVPLIDGKDYFSAVYNWIAKTGLPPSPNNQDAVFIVGWLFDPDFLMPAPSGSIKIAPLLASKAANGVDVRLVLNGTAVIYGIKALPFYHNLKAAERLRALKLLESTPPPPPPLAESILFDWSGANWTGSHHQKAVVVKAGTELVAFLGGMDFNKNRLDAAPHNSKEWRESNDPWGWHDIGVQLRGTAAEAVWENFRQRWDEARSLPEKTYPPLSIQIEDRKPFNPLPIKAPPDTAPTPAPSVTSQQSVQVLRSRFHLKIPRRCRPGGVLWNNSPRGGIYEIYNTLKKAIASAEQYIYIEDQFLENNQLLKDSALETIPPEYNLFDDIASRIKAKPDLKVIFVGSGRSDPADVFPGERNTKLTNSIDSMLELLRQRTTDLTKNVAVWRLKDITVHSKLILIDDEFAAIGSANFQSRSMYGVDSELHAAIVAEDDPNGTNLVKKLRVDLWAEHLQLLPPRCQKP